MWMNFVPIDIQFDTDHQLLTGRLKTSRVKEYKKYVERRQKPPVTLFPSQRDKKRVDESPNELLRSIMESISEEKKRRREKKSRILDKTYEMLSSKVKALRQNNSEQVKILNKELRRSLRKDRRNRVNKISEEIERNLEDNNIVEAYGILHCWYKKRFWEGMINHLQMI